ncbi:hypothetical protein [Nitratifractor sp.]
MGSGSLKCALGGVVWFWGVDMAFTFWHQTPVDRVSVILKTIMIPLLFFLIYRSICRRFSHAEANSVFTLTALWLGGPFYLYLLGLFLPEYHPLTLVELERMIVSFPLSTLSLATYDGSLFALTAVSILLFVRTVIPEIQPKGS